jgi:hypothetical protein
MVLFLVLSQTPTVTIRLSDPQSDGSGNIVARQDSDVTMDCYVENLPVDTTVSVVAFYLYTAFI